MRTSSDFFKQDQSRFEALNSPFVPRPTVPLYAEKISSKPNLPLPPRVNYPIFTKPAQPLQKTALEQIQKEIQNEVTNLQKTKPTLDQLIQNALKQKIQHDQQQARQKIITLKKMSPPIPNPYLNQQQTPLKPTRHFWWPTEGDQQTKSPKVILTKPSQIIPNPNLPKPSPPKINLTPTQVTPEPQIQDVPILPKKSLFSMLLPWLFELKVKLTKLPTPNVVKPKVVPHPKAATNIKIVPPQVSTNPINVAKTAFHISSNFLNYFLFTISPESDPYNDFDRQLMVYGLKTGGYLTMLGGIFELMRNIKIGLSLNGELEVISIFLISAIFFFFGENLSILFKPSNPYQIHEVI